MRPARSHQHTGTVQGTGRAEERIQEGNAARGDRRGACGIVGRGGVAGAGSRAVHGSSGKDDTAGVKDADGKVVHRRKMAAALWACSWLGGPCRPAWGDGC
jgi:hypothetical protein